MLYISFVVTVPVSQLRASPRKGSKLLLWQICVCDQKKGLIVIVLLQILWLFCWSCIYHQCLKVLLVVLTVVGFGLMAADPESIVVTVS